MLSKVQISWHREFWDTSLLGVVDQQTKSQRVSTSDSDVQRIFLEWDEEYVDWQEPNLCRRKVRGWVMVVVW